MTAMTKLFEQAIARIRELPEEDQDAIALAIISMANADASALPLDEQTRAAIREGLARAERGEFVPDDVVAAADKRHGI
jgi:predicted transcriptional regulator